MLGFVDTTMGAEVEARLLGPLSLRINGQDATPSARKPRRLLALLLLEANRPLSVEQLTRGMWDGLPPRSAHTMVQMYVMQLRKDIARADATAAREVVATSDGGYVLALGERQLDLTQYRALAHSGATALDECDAARAADALHAALDCWRGRALADVRPSRLLEGEVRRLEESRLRTRELCVDADLRLGRQHAVLDELAALCARHPFNENLHLGHLVALYRCGLRVDALKACHDFRTRLAERLGLQPAAPLRQIHELVLRADQDLLDVSRRGRMGLHPKLLAAAPRDLAS